MSDQPNRSTPRFHFLARLDDGGEAIFMEATGLDDEYEPIGYRASDDRPPSTSKMPGIAKTHSLMLKRGLVAESSSFHAWIETVEPDDLPERRTLHLDLIDENGTHRQSWTLRAAQPTKVRSSPSPEAGETAIETLEIEYEAIELDPEG